jgi:acyl-CoA synthetase (AMP-forming)/AMP-acid ligase II
VPTGEPADLIHAPLARWARERGDAVAVRNADTAITFSALNDAVQRRVDLLHGAPVNLLVDDRLGMTDRLVEFLAIVASGRTAAVGDPDWPAAVKAAVREGIAQQNSLAQSPAGPPNGATPFYIGYTSGSTGTPKGYRRNHRSWTTSFGVCLDTFGQYASGTILAPGRDSHSLFLFGMVLGLWTGAGVVVQEKFSAIQTLDTLRSGLAPCLVAVPSQLLLILELAKRRRMPPIEDLRLIMVSGARWNRARTADLQALFPRARVIEFYGASETSFIAWLDAAEVADMAASEPVPEQAVGRPFSNVEISIRPAPQGLIYVRSPMLFTDYVGAAADGTGVLRDGDWLSVRDVGCLSPQGWLCLEGRQNRMIVTRGKNLFPEELETLLESFPGVAQASVHGVNDPLRGLQVVAVLHPADDLPVALNALLLKAFCRERLEAFKAPRRYFLCADWPHTASGKTDHQAIARALNPAQFSDTVCLIPLH